MSHRARNAILTLLTTVTACASAWADEQSLEQAANDPTASLMSFQLSNASATNYHHSDAEDSAWSMRMALPYKIGAQSNILRVTVPVITKHPALSDGLSDITVFNMLTFDRPWGRLALGAVALLPTGGRRHGAEQWGLGPSLGFVVQREGMVLGMLNQNIFSVAGDEDRDKVKTSSFQPVVSYKLGQGWSMGLSEMQVTYDWRESRWSSLPLGLSLSKLQRIGKLPVQFNMQAEHNFADERVAPANVVRLSAKLILPTF